MSLAELRETHTAGERDAAGWPHCKACGFRWPCPDLRNALPEQTADEMEVVALVDVGWSVWRARPGGRDGWDDATDLGGTVIGWWDDSDGHRWFLCLDFPRGRHRMHTIRSDQVDAAACGLPNPSTLRSHARHLAREFSQCKGILSEGDIKLLDVAHQLAHLVA